MFNDEAENDLVFTTPLGVITTPLGLISITLPLELNWPAIVDGVEPFTLFNEKELGLIMNSHSNTDLQDFFNFAYYTGARRGEICNLQAHQIHPTYIEVKGKTDKRIIKLNSQARHILFCREKLWSYKGDFVSKKFKAYLRQLNIKDAQFHDLSRTFGLNLIKSGGPIYTVSKLLGHSSVRITEEHYAPLLISDIEEFELPTGS